MVFLPPIKEKEEKGVRALFSEFNSKNQSANIKKGSDPFFFLACEE
jgi:hypothetical protein